MTTLFSIDPTQPRQTSLDNYLKHTHIEDDRPKVSSKPMKVTPMKVTQQEAAIAAALIIVVAISFIIAPPLGAVVLGGVTLGEGGYFLNKQHKHKQEQKKAQQRLEQSRASRNPTPPSDRFDTHFAGKEELKSFVSTLENERNIRTSDHTKGG